MSIWVLGLDLGAGLAPLFRSRLGFSPLIWILVEVEVQSYYLQARLKSGMATGPYYETLDPIQIRWKSMKQKKKLQVI